MTEKKKERDARQPPALDEKAEPKHYVLVVQSARHTLKLTKQEEKQNGKVVE